MSNAVTASNSGIAGASAFATAVFALGLAFCAAFFAPMIAAELGSTLADPMIGVLYVLPIPLGILAAWLGARGLGGISAPAEAPGGGLAFFAMLVGLLASVTGIVLTYARLVEGSIL